jgi:hypothetical protein
MNPWNWAIVMYGPNGAVLAVDYPFRTAILGFAAVALASLVFLLYYGVVWLINKRNAAKPH